MVGQARPARARLFSLGRAQGEQDMRGWHPSPHGPYSEQDHEWRRDWDNWEHRFTHARQEIGGVRDEVDRLVSRAQQLRMRAWNFDFEDREAILAERRELDAQRALLNQELGTHDHERRAQSIHKRLVDAGLDGDSVQTLYARAMNLVKRIIEGGIASSGAAEREWIQLEAEVFDVVRSTPTASVDAVDREAGTTGIRSALRVGHSVPGASPPLPGERDAWESVDGLLARLNLGPHTITWNVGEPGSGKTASASVPWVGDVEQPPEALLVGRMLREHLPEKQLLALLNRLEESLRGDETGAAIRFAWSTLLQIAKDTALRSRSPVWAAAAIGTLALMRSANMHSLDAWDHMRDERWTTLYDEATATLLEDVADGATTAGSDRLRDGMRRVINLMHDDDPLAGQARSSAQYRLDWDNGRLLIDRTVLVDDKGKELTKHSGAGYVIVLVARGKPVPRKHRPADITAAREALKRATDGELTIKDRRPLDDRLYFSEAVSPTQAVLRDS